jgi:hypothetical protein
VQQGYFKAIHIGLLPFCIPHWIRCTFIYNSLQLQKSYNTHETATSQISLPCISLKFHQIEIVEIRTVDRLSYKFGECLLLFTPKSFVLPSYNKKPKD